MNSPQSIELFAAGTNASATVAIQPNAAQNGAFLLSLITTGFSGTIDIQGKAHISDTYVNIPYVILGAGPVAFAVAQISKTTETAHPLYMIPICFPFMQIVMTRSAGSLALYGYSSPSTFNADYA